MLDNSHNMYYMPCGDLCATTCLDQAENQPTYEVRTPPLVKPYCLCVSPGYTLPRNNQTSKAFVRCHIHHGAVVLCLHAPPGISFALRAPPPLR